MKMEPLDIHAAASTGGRSREKHTSAIVQKDRRLSLVKAIQCAPNNLSIMH